jgi:hypothetical protein
MKALAVVDTSYRDIIGGPPKGFTPLIEEVAYEQWHRMLFARFLEQNNLLIHPHHGVPVSLDECADVAVEEGEPDEWMVAAKFAGAMLPGIFQRDDPAVRVRFAANDRTELERILKALPSELFMADDALGWVYQFWQTKARDEVNLGGRRVAGKDLAPVTQLFTEHYMVRFLLENSLGAWWFGQHPRSPLVAEWQYLRRGADGAPSAGAFSEWPRRAAEITVMDPCCGSGHFLVAAAEMLRRMRMEEEGLTPAEAAAAVLQENIFGLELDPRCTQLAAFALVFDAWKAGLDPETQIVPNLACSGIAVSGQLQDWQRLAGDDANLRFTLEELFELFKNAPDLGSLINPASLGSRDTLFTSRYEQVSPLLQQALATAGEDPVAAVFGASVEGARRAGLMLTRQFTLVATNVPYLAFRKMGDVLRNYVQLAHREARQDLATAFLDRIGEMVIDEGACAVVVPQNWLFLGSFAAFRRRLLASRHIRVVAELGAGAFDSISGAVVNVVLIIIQRRVAGDSGQISALRVSNARGAEAKSVELMRANVATVSQRAQLGNPDARIMLDVTSGGTLLGNFADALQGMSTGDYARFGRLFWELGFPAAGWITQQSTVVETYLFGGRQHIILWEDGRGRMEAFAKANRENLHDSHRRGIQAWGKSGVAVSLMGALPATLYTGEAFDGNVGIILPRDPANLAAIWAFCSSQEFGVAVRRIDRNIKVTNATLVKVPFDLKHWSEVASQAFPDGLPPPRSTDPTQWLATGSVTESDSPLQVAVARLLGYRWPNSHRDALDELAEHDGIVCLPSVGGRKSAAERLRALLALAYGSQWSPGMLEGLLADVGFSDKSLELWLRDTYFEQHCRLFHQRPFIWQIWDGRRGGFSALINYHSLDRPKLEKLAYSYLGSWLERQRDEKNSGIAGADDRLAAALALQQQLALILKGEPPYDIFVRWKEAHEQALGWEPDIDDGVRLNIRPFVAAGVLRWRPNIKWDKDRGKNPDGTDRTNNDHLTLAVKLKARLRIGVPA